MKKANNEMSEMSRAVARIQAAVLALVCAVIGGGLLFLLTAWLLIKGGPNVGMHLQLLDNYLIGYSVSWPGSLVGFFYGALICGLMGWLVGWTYNLIVRARQH